MVQIIGYEEKYLNDLAKLLADFRVTLRKFKNENTEPDVEDTKDELKYYFEKKFPLYLAIIDNKAVGYILLRVDGVVWVEHIYVSEEYRRQGIASLLYQKGEQYSKDFCDETLFNYVHPNNDVMIAFLRKNGYDVLNLIEIRKPFKGEKTFTKIKIGNNEFDY